MGTSVGNLSVKCGLEEVKSYLTKEVPSEVSVYVSEGSDGFTNIFPPNESFKFLSTLAKQISKDLGTISMCGEVYDSDLLQVAIYNKGDLVFQYELGETASPMVTGELQALSDLFGGVINIGEYNEILNVIEKFPFAEDRYWAIIEPFGFSYALRQTGYRYIENDLGSMSLEEYNSSPDNPKLVRIH